MTKRSNSNRTDRAPEQENPLLNFNLRNVFPERLDRPPAKIKAAVEKEDLDILIRSAKELGADEAVAVEAGNIVTNEIMRMKCRIPTCWGYNSGYFCPPHSACAAEMADIVSDYDWALFLSIPPSASDSYAERYERINKMKEIVGRTEVEAQYTGYIKSMGFTGGPCTVCGIFSPEWVEKVRNGENAQQCPLYTRESQLCFQYYHCRPAAQAVGIDIYATANNVGWADRLSAPPPALPGRIDWPCLPGVYPILIG